MSGWGCPHESKGRCGRLNDIPCEPGMKGCVLAGRFVFSDPSKNTARALREKADDSLQERLKEKG
ncbi:hypothetical protein SAMN05421721_102234 [Ectothiorhodospira mobilis]|uniref:Uncharacterized protein n=1 Tax=Ectothiorhodospira mobilis TaxID=195064 RepID=A0A1I4PUM6_ECTMO|nr:hypothetical protein [Ectothiorhodospira mobilis]SFM31170.1 hypothetical protein SAMN05421721_102234 [Ectothiorhodospira mobilis]